MAVVETISTDHASRIIYLMILEVDARSLASLGAETATDALVFVDMNLE